jgi:hypothetical protein
LGFVLTSPGFGICAVAVNTMHARAGNTRLSTVAIYHSVPGT